MSASHPLLPLVAPACALYPHQAPALFQTAVDLSLAQQWRDLTVVDLEQCQCAVLRGTPRLPKRAPPAVVLPMVLTAPTSLAALTAVLDAVAARFPPSPKPSSAPAPEPAPSSTAAAAAAPSDAAPEAPTIYLAMVEKDSSIVYYVLRQGIVSPKEVPE
ncbi:hypothetical protein DMC30DRAFT_444883 [Rhodotorula diobovata]|uniref:tRNA-splicing endonuclease subunit Sen15 domain-containing protein n=1 Tax=Rhodotorula diobovata TaxID=5288 RepID=A0A5C5G164_9BASI|nr:hypothetical protein DMC30DRAFT_444883 [Rhodotorula diobovata]